MLSTHHLRVWLNMAYSTGVKTYYYLYPVYLHMWGVAAWWGGAKIIPVVGVSRAPVVSNFFISWFLIVTSIRNPIVVLLTVSPYQPIVSYFIVLSINLSDRTEEPHKDSQSIIPYWSRETFESNHIPPECKPETLSLMLTFPLCLVRLLRLHLHR